MILDILEIELQSILDRIHTGNSNLDEKQEEELLFLLRKFNSDELSLDLSAKYLGVCEKTFRNYVKNGWIPEGIKESGKSKYWLKSDLDKWKLEIAKKI